MTSKLHPEVRRELARQQEMAVKEFTKAFPSFVGEEGLATVTKENVKMILRKFNDTVHTLFKQLGTDYSAALKEVTVEPDLTVVTYLNEKIHSVQLAIVRKIKSVLDQQFKLMIEEIKKLQVIPVSIGYNPPEMPSRQKQRQPSPYQNQARRVIEPIYPSRRRGTSYDVGDYYIPMGSRLTNYGQIIVNDPGGDTRTFTGSVVNTMRYITAGALVGLPAALYYEAFSSAKEFDNALSKAMMNLAVNAEDNFRAIAEKRVQERFQNASSLGSYGISAVQYNNQAERERLIQEEMQRLQEMSSGGAVPALQRIANMYAVPQADIGNAYEIATRMFTDPYEAIAMTRSVAKFRALEDLDVNQASLGLLGILSQWGVGGYESNKVANMIIKAANQYATTAKDIIEVQNRAGAVFMQNMPNMPKEDALAASIALSAMFMQATSKSGNEAGTFWKTVFEAPFRPNAADYLQKLSQMPGFEMLNPYKQVTNPTTGQKVNAQKTGVEMLMDLIQAMPKMDDKTRAAMIDKVFGQWNVGGVQAMQAFIDSIKKGGEDINKIFESIKNVTEEQTAGWIAMRMNTWDFQIRRIRTNWETATFGVFQDLKPQFTMVINYLSSLLRLIRDNSGQVAMVISMLSKIALAAGVRFVGSKVFDMFKNQRTNKIGERVDEMRFYLNEEGRALRMRKLAIGTSMEEAYGRLNELIGQKQNLNIDELVLQRDKKKAEIETTQSLLQDMEQKGMQNTKEYKNLTRHKQNLEKGYNYYSEKVEKSKARIPAIDDRINKQIQEILRLEEEMAKVDSQALKLNNRMKMLQTATKELGIDEGKLKNEMHEVALGFQLGTSSSVSFAGGLEQVNKVIVEGESASRGYEARISETMRQMGMSSADIRRFRNELERVNKDFEEGRMSVQEYISEIRKLQRAHETATFGLVGGGLGESAVKSQKGTNLLDMIAFGSMFGLGMTSSRRGIFSRVRDFLQSKNIRDLIGKGSPMVGPSGETLLDRFGNPIYYSDVMKENKLRTGSSGFLGGLLGKFGNLGGRLGNFLKIGRSVLRFLGRPIPYFFLFDTLLDPISSLMMSPEERLQQNALKKQELANSLVNISNSPFMGKLLYSLLLGSNMLTDSISSLLGGTAPNLIDYAKAISVSFTKSGKDLENALKDTLGYEKQLKEAQAKIAEQDAQFFKDHPEYQDLNGDQLKDFTRNLDWNKVYNIEDLQQVLSRINQLMQQDLDKSQSKFTIERVKMIMSGIREDSKAMRDALHKYFQENINIIEEAIKSIQEKQDLIKQADPQGYMNNEMYQTLEAERLSKEAQVAQLKLQDFQNTYSAVDEVMNTLDRRLQLAEAEGTIARDQAIVAGATEDSFAVKQIDVNTLERQNSWIQQAIASLQNVIQENGYRPGMSQYEDIWLQIKQLEAQQNDNLVKIHQDLTKSLPTFNLPSDIKPLTYWEAMTRDSTHKNLSIRSGDVNVNITVGSVTGDADLDKLAGVVNQAVRQAQLSVTQALTQQVKANMQGQYFSVFGGMR